MPRSHANRHNTHKQRHHPRRRKYNPNLQWLWLLPVAAMIVIFSLMVFNKKAEISEIAVEEAFEKYEAGVILLDVRTQEEWDEQHVPGSMLIPKEELPDRLGELPADEEIVVICRSGNRSRQAVEILLEAGFTRVSSVQDGIIAWEAAGYPVETTP